MEPEFFTARNFWLVDNIWNLNQREEKLKIRLHSKNCSNPPKNSETIKPPGKRFNKTEMGRSWSEYNKKFH